MQWEHKNVETEEADNGRRKDGRMKTNENFDGHKEDCLEHLDNHSTQTLRIKYNYNFSNFVAVRYNTLEPSTMSFSLPQVTRGNLKENPVVFYI